MNQNNNNDNMNENIEQTINNDDETKVKENENDESHLVCANYTRNRGFNANVKDVDDKMNPEKKVFWNWGNVDLWYETANYLYQFHHFPRRFQYQDESSDAPDFPAGKADVVDTLVCEALRHDIYFSHVAYEDLASDCGGLQHFITLNMANERVANSAGFTVDNDEASEELKQWADLVYHFWQSAAAALQHKEYKWTEKETNAWNRSHEMWEAYDDKMNSVDDENSHTSEIDVNTALFFHKLAEQAYNVNAKRDALFWNGDYQYRLRGIVGGQKELVCGKVYFTSREDLDENEQISMSNDDVIVTFQGCHSDAKKRYALCANATLVDCKIGDYKASNGTKIHKGFRNLYNDKVHKPLKDLIIKAKKAVGGEVDRYIFVGHSMGGALATLAAAAMLSCQHELGESTEVLKSKIYLCTFGAPAVGNYDFEHVISNVVDYSRRVHFWVDGDTVPHLPIQLTLNPDKAKNFDPSKHAKSSYSTLACEYKLSTKGLESKIISKIYPSNSLPSQMAYNDYHDPVTYYVALLNFLRNGQHQIDWASH